MINLVKTDDEIVKVESLAREIWNESYSEIISRKQIDYMLEKFQSFSTLKKQIAEGYEYYLIEDSEPCGFIGFKQEKDYLFLSKIYILKSHRGKHLAKKAFELVKSKCNNKIRLTVNKNNINAYSVYKKFGFKTIDSVVTDIGNGFVMDDYIMELRV